MSPRRASILTNEHVLLALLDQKPMHGYELYQELSTMQGISLIWNITQATLYATMDKLEAQGFLTSQLIQGETYPPRTDFYLTAVGKQALDAWMKTPVRRAREIRQEFLAKLIVSRRYGKDATLELIHRQEQTCQAWLKEAEKNITSPSQAGMDEWLVYSFRISRGKEVLKWLAECARELIRLPEDAPQE